MQGRLRHPRFITHCIYHESRFCFVASGAGIKIFSVSSGKLVSQLNEASPSTSSEIPPAQITGLFLSPSNSLQLITTSLDGYIRIWDYLEGFVLRTIDCGHPIICATCSNSAAINMLDCIFVALLHSGNDNKSTTHIYEISLKRTDARRTKLGRAKGAFMMSISNDGQRLVILSKRRIHIVTLLTPPANANRGQNLMEDHFIAFDGFQPKSSDTFSALSIHPSESYFVTGDSKGQIRYWYILTSDNLAQIQTSLTTSSDKINSYHSIPRSWTATVHWHAHPVSSLQFTPNGAYLLSGGEEAVLVAWQISSRHREYVPRLGAPIASISIGGGEGREQEFVVKLADSSVVFVGAGNLKIVRTIAGIKNSKFTEFIH